MSMLGSAAAAALLVLGGGLTACSSSSGGGGGGGDVVASDTTLNPGDTVGGDALTDTTTTSNTDTTSTNTDTVSVETDTLVADTDTATDTHTPPARQCTDDELNTFNTCFTACSGDAVSQCQQGCFSAMSAGCQAAYSALVSCLDTNNCIDDSNHLDPQCATDNCADETAGVSGPPPEPSDCNPVTNDGCGSTQNCTLLEGGDIGCAPAGTAAIGEACGSGCARGACLATDASGTTGACYEFCDQANNTCPDNRPCNVGLQGSDYTFCGDILVPCDIFQQDCESGQGCYVGAQSGATSCATAGTVAAGQSCGGTAGTCAPGLDCAGSTSADLTCYAVCDPTATTSTCATGAQCQAWVGDVGLCVPQP